MFNTLCFFSPFKVLSLNKQRLKVPASITKSDKCSLAKAFANKNHTHGNVLCTRVRRGKIIHFCLYLQIFHSTSCAHLLILEHEKIQGEGFLIKRIGKRWFLRGVPLRKTNLGGKKFIAFNDIFPHLRWIAENSKGINALPDVPKATKSYGTLI
jgi:hypothetical protein